MTVGATPNPEGVRFSVWSGAAERIWVSLFDEHDRESDRIELKRGPGGIFSALAAGLGVGARYGFRADGPYDPDRGQLFDPSKLLMDPYALAIDRPYRFDPRLAARRGEGGDTSFLMPKAIVTALPDPVQLQPPRFQPGGLIYEIPARAFTKRHPDVPEAMRGTLAALAHPAIIDHLLRLGVDAVELMPITAWMDERHLQPLGLSNAWGYNPVSFMALDPRLAPGGWPELRETVATLHQAGIGVILDVVFNHTAESDALGPTLSLRGLDNLAYYRHDGGGRLMNDTGTGNTLACDHVAVQRLVLDSLRSFVRHAGVDGFRFDLATVLGRSGDGFDPDAPLLRAIVNDPEIGSRVLIAEPWDIGPDGYQLGSFPAPFLEWNDRCRDDLRRFWRGDAGTVGSLATRLAGSSDVFSRSGASRTRSVNFVAAHDGMTLADLVAYEEKHNEANGEQNRDGHGENLSWNNGVEGRTDDQAILARRRSDVKALLATLFLSRGTIMLTAGDEFGRTQAGNNNAYAQDNGITWLDWAGRDRDLEAFAAAASKLRRELPILRETAFLSDDDVTWLRPDGEPMEAADWEAPDARALAMLLHDAASLLAIVVNGAPEARSFRLPAAGASPWRLLLASSQANNVDGGSITLAGRAVALLRAD